MRDVASVVSGAENTQLAAWSGLTPAIILNVQRQPGANVIAVVDAINRILPQLRSSIPTGISIVPLTDRTTTIAPRSPTSNSSCCSRSASWCW